MFYMLYTRYVSIIVTNVAEYVNAVTSLVACQNI